MDIQTFLDEFGVIANATGGINRLKGLFIDLAIQGKLVKMIKKYPAQINLDNIIKHKAYLIKQKRIRKPKALVDTVSFEKPFNIPNHWLWEQLGNISYLITDGVHKTPKYIEKGVPFLSIKDISKGKLDFSNTKFISNNEHKEISKRCNPEFGDILFCRIGTLGKCVVIDVKQSFSIFVSLGLIKVLKSDISPEYICYVLNSLYMIKQFEKVKAGGSHTNKLNLNSMSGLLIPFPPLNEQKFIVTKLNELMSLCDKLEALQKKRERLCKLTRTSALDALANAQNSDELRNAWDRVQGNILPLMYDSESINSLKKLIISLTIKGHFTRLKKADRVDNNGKIEEIKQSRKIRNSIISLPDSLPWDAPKGWQWYRLGNIVSEITYGTSKRCTYMKGIQDQEMTGVLRIPNMVKGHINYNDIKYTKLTEVEKKKYELLNNDLLIIRSNGSQSLVGRSFLVDSNAKNFAFAGYLIRLRLASKNAYRDFVHFFMESDFVREQIENPIRTTSGVKNINIAEIANIIVCLPPYDEQVRLTKVLNSFFILCDHLESLLLKFQFIVNLLAQALVSSITGTQSKETKIMKHPQTELISILKLAKTPNKKDHAPLSTILLKHKGELSAKALWHNTGMEIDKFYQQLKNEMAKGWIVEPEKAYMKVLEEPDAS